MATYDVTADEMRAIANRIDELANEYQSLYNNNLFQSLVSGDLTDAYKGTDAQTLIDRIKSYQVPFDAMKNQLNNYAEFLRGTAFAYEDTKNALAQEAASVGKQ